MSQYHFITHWEVDASPAEVYRTLEAVEDLTRWWPSVYLDAAVLAPGAPGGVGKQVALYTKGWLPYTLRWTFRVTQAEFPRGFALEAEGDFCGTGVWTFEADPENERCRITYDWRIEARKPLLRRLSFLLRPLFSANHLWAMRMGERSLRLELQRRKAHTEQERAAVPPPPGPVFPHNLTSNKVFAAIVPGVF